MNTFADSFVYLNPDIHFAETIIEVADFDGDGFNDLLTHKGNSFGFDELIIQYNQGDNNFTPEVIYDRYDDYGDAEVGDIDGDGDLDIAVAIVLGDVPLVVLYRNEAGGYDEVKIPQQFSNGYTTVKLNDLDTDGDLDILTLGEENDIYLLENVDNYSSDNTLTTVALNDILFFKLADMNNDSLLDIVAVTANSAPNFVVHVIPGNGGFDFSTPVETVTFPGSSFFGYPNFNYVGNNLPLYDIDADGVLDIVYTDGFGDPNRIVWLRNNTEITSSTEWPADPSFTVHPNPARDRLEIGGTVNPDGHRYEIWSLAGYRVAGGVCAGRSLDVSRLPAGAYVLRVEGILFRLRFVKR